MVYLLITKYTDVHAPLKIFSTLIRALDNEMAYTRKDGPLSQNESCEMEGNNSEGEYELKDEDEDGEGEGTADNNN